MALGVYWIGANGNIYTKDPILGVKDRGSGGGVIAPGDKSFGGASYSQIADPNPPRAPQQQPSQTLPDYGGVSAAPTGPTAAQTSPLLASLATLDEILGNKNTASQSEYNRAIQGYDAADALDKRAYDENTQQNEKSLTSNNQAALLNAANGATGLRGLLSSLGALGGSGLNIISKLVGLAANQDTGAARDTFDTNATALNQNWAQTEQAGRQRREDADAILKNSIQNNKADVLSSRQSIYQQLAQLYGPDDAQGNVYASKAASLSAPIAATTKATVAPYAKASSLFSPEALKTYLAGTQNLNVNTSGSDATAINSPVFPGQKKKDTLPGVA